MHSLERTRAFHWFLWKQYVGHWCYDDVFLIVVIVKQKYVLCKVRHIFCGILSFFSPLGCITIKMNTNNQFLCWKILIIGLEACWMPGNHFNHCLKLQTFHHGGNMFFKIKIKFITMPTLQSGHFPKGIQLLFSVIVPLERFLNKHAGWSSNMQ